MKRRSPRRGLVRDSVRAAAPALTLLIVACAGDISPKADDAPGGDQVPLPGPGGADAVFVGNEDGSYRAAVDASNGSWVYLDLDTQTQVDPATPEASDAWDIALLGADIKLNGGVSGAPPNGQPVVVHAAKTADAATPYPFGEITQAPTATAVAYVTDEAGDPLGLTAPAYAMTHHPDADTDPDILTGAGDHGWYHTTGVLAGEEISARINVGYVLRSVECRYFKLRMTAYVDAGGAPAHPQFDLLEIPGPGCTATGAGSVAPLGRASFAGGSASMLAEVDASDENLWVHLDLTNAMQVAPTDPGDDAEGWDIALRRADIKLNGGASGAGSVGLHDGLRDDWGTRTSVPMDAEWHTDAADALAFVTYPPREAGGECAFAADGDYGWYYYSGFCDKGDGTHHISPRDVVYIVRGRDGLYWKLRVLDYYGDDGTAAQLTLEYASLPAP